MSASSFPNDGDSNQPSAIQAAYGRLNGILTAPALAASAVAPFAGAALAYLLGSYAAGFLVLAGLAAVAALLMFGAMPRQQIPPIHSDKVV
jgi:hypothetical protein